MDKSDVIQVLRDHEPELKAAGIVHLRLFGSLARGVASDHSDVDLMVEFNPAKHLTLVTLGSLQSRLSELLHAPVDLSPYDSMREPIGSQARREAVLAF